MTVVQPSPFAGETGLGKLSFTLACGLYMYGAEMISCDMLKVLAGELQDLQGTTCKHDIMKEQLANMNLSLSHL